MLSPYVSYEEEDTCVCYRSPSGIYFRGVRMHACELGL